MTPPDVSPTSSPRARAADALRPLALERGAAPYAEGSCLVIWGRTRVLCTASVEPGVPGWRTGTGKGWITAEYAMLPRATHTRTARERGQLGGRTQEIQRLIGRSVRAMVDDFAFGEFTMRVDCDVLQADGGTRVAAVTGASVAVLDAFAWMVREGRCSASPVRRRVAGVSVGVVAGVPLLDLEYADDVRADVDMNVVATSEGRYVEVQGTGERTTFDRELLAQLLSLADSGLRRIGALQMHVMEST
jgi:ribonuclease PH